MKKIIYTSRQAFVETMSGVCPNGKYAVFFTAYTQRFLCSGRPPYTDGLGFLSPSPSLLLQLKKNIGSAATNIYYCQVTCHKFCSEEKTTRKS